MASESFPEVTGMDNRWTCWVLYNPKIKKFYGYYNARINYGWTDTPQVVCEGISSVQPQTRFTAEYLLKQVRSRWEDWSTKLDNETIDILFPNQRDIEVVQIEQWRDPNDRNKLYWKLVDA